MDTGGTFTDLVLLSGGTLRTRKVPSTPDDPARAVIRGLRELLPGGEAFELVHGSTVATNALLERKGARVALVTNRGFEDVLEIGRQARPRLYALEGWRAPPLVPRERRIGVRGRLGPDGTEVEAPDPAELDALRSRLGDVDAVAVCLLHSYARPDHEEAVAEALDGLGLPLSLSSRILPEYREFERTSTTVLNAYVAPLVSRYLGRMEREARARRVRIMASGGGSIPVERAKREPVHMVLSGPAGGVMGGLWWGRRAGYERVLTFDMGGTSTDVSLAPGRSLRTRESTVGGQPVAIPVVDIHTVGAGGGSVARVDRGGALRVGPESAGARPGPVSYGRGGREITVTDAHVWLGRLPFRAFLGGQRPLDREAVRPPLEALARTLGRSLPEAAEGVLAVADTAMERALRVISVERGHDPGEVALVAFGGAGGLHAVELARRLGVPRVLVPPHPGLLSAVGMLTVPVSRESSRTVLLAAAPGTGPDGGPDLHRELGAVFDELADEAVGGLVAEGHRREGVTVERSVDARYRGQSFELGVPAGGWVEAFHRRHQARYGYRREGSAVEAVTLRVRARVDPPEWTPPTLPAAAGPPSTRTGRVHVEGAFRDVAVVARDDLRAGHELTGPAVVSEYSATTWIPPGWRGRVHAEGLVELQRVEG